MVCAEIIVSPPRPTAAEIIIGSCLPSSVEHLLDGDQRRLGVQRVEDRLDQQQVDAARDQRAHLLGVGRLDLVERARRETPASSASGEFDSDTVSGPMAPATKRGRPVGVGDAVGPLAALPRGLLVDLPARGR